MELLRRMRHSCVGGKRGATKSKERCESVRVNASHLGDEIGCKSGLGLAKPMFNKR